jgi:glucose-1-phosphate adenylyltransferase
VVVEEGAVVRNSVVFADSVVSTGARLDWVIVDQGCLVAPGTTVGREDADGTGDPDQVAIVGRDSVVGEDLGEGARLEPGTT